MNDVLIYSIYIFGIPIAYRVEKWSFKKDVGSWTVGIRNMVVFLSFLSWLGIVITLIIRSGDLFDNETPIK